MLYQKPSRLSKIPLIFGSYVLCAYYLTSIPGAIAQGISEMGGAYAGSAKLMPTKDDADALSRIFKQGSQESPTASTSAPNGSAEDESALLKESIKQANKDCLLAQEKEKAGKLLEAQKLYAKALAIRRRYWGSQDLSQVTILYKIAELHQKLGNPAGAEICLKQALTIQAKHVGPGAFEVVPILEQLAKVSIAQKKFEEAESYNERILALQERKNGPDSEKTFAARLNLIDAALGLKDYKEAKVNLDKTQETYNRLKETDHKIAEEQKNDYVFLLDRYVTTLQSLNKPEEVQLYIERANALRSAK